MQEMLFLGHCLSSLWFCWFRIGRGIPVWTTEHIIVFLKLPCSSKGSRTAPFLLFIIDANLSFLFLCTTPKLGGVKMSVIYNQHVSRIKGFFHKRHWNVYCTCIPPTFQQHIIFNISFWLTQVLHASYSIT